MGQKVHPTGIRLGIVKDWSSKWYADTKTFPEYIRADHLIRDRAPFEEVQHYDLHGASRNRDRKEG